MISIFAGCRDNHDRTHSRKSLKIVKGRVQVARRERETESWFTKQELDLPFLSETDPLYPELLIQSASNGIFIFCQYVADRLKTNTTRRIHMDIKGLGNV